MLQAQSIRVKYGDRLVLTDISLQVASGSILGVIGPNGAGKTTLIRALSGVVPLSAGRILAQGKDIFKLSTVERARRVAVVPQARSLPASFTGWQLVLLGRTPHLNWLGHISAIDEQCVNQALERAQALDLAGRRLGELSGGEQQRLLLARALAQNAPILLLDEPTTHLDLQHQIGLLDKVRELARSEGLAVVVALHDLNLVSRYSDQVALLVEGNLRAVGTPEEILQPELLGQVYQVPLQLLHTAGTGRPVILPAIL
ncbi:MAG: ABC transporter ATP-binding protein [Anaerolineaceae bacterium]|nr:ABC transporter ATP-binding protein [Anaerolineaceae bacterium]